MAYATPVKFYSFLNDVFMKRMDLENDDLRVVLSNVAPSRSNTKLSDITQIANGNGYTTGGILSPASLSNTTGTVKLTMTDVQWTATGNVGPFRYVIIYNDTATDDPLICYMDFGSEITLANTEKFTVDFDATGGLFSHQ